MKTRSRFPLPRISNIESAQASTFGPSRSAFTLIELLAVLAVLALLAATVLPALAGAKPNTNAFQCMNNLRRFMAVWRMYAEDNSDKVINNFGNVGTSAEVSNGTYRNWANNSVDWSVNQMNTNVLLLKSGIMAPYLGGVIDIHKCPTDNYLSPSQRAAGWTSRTRSISMNAFFGPYSTNTNDPWALGKNQFFPNYRQWLKTSQMSAPADFWVILDEHPDSINDGFFLNDPAASHWVDIPASYHNGSGGLAFADGRAELHKWLSASTRLPVRYVYTSPSVDALSLADYQWLMARTAVPY